MNKINKNNNKITNSLIDLQRKINLKKETQKERLPKSMLKIIFYI